MFNHKGAHFKFKCTQKLQYADFEMCTGEIKIEKYSPMKQSIFIFYSHLGAIIRKAGPKHNLHKENFEIKKKKALHAENQYLPIFFCKVKPAKGKNVTFCIHP